jgi:signal transduction histidine kinase
MKEIVLTRPPYMNPSELRIADMHTVLNILNVLIGELSLIEPTAPDLVERWKHLTEEMNGTAREIKEGGDLTRLMPRVRKVETTTIALARDLLAEEKVAARCAEIKASIANLESVFSIFKTRMDELEFRAEDPDVWILIESDAFRKLFEDGFTAIAKNSKGAYGIHFELARKGDRDYYLELKLRVHLDHGKLWIPLRLIDVLRDLTANARKYTAPGGKIGLELSQDAEGIRAVVEDNGCGIPEEEIEKVTEFGYRASNVRRRPTQGGGFGLTKAAWLVTSWGGSLTLRSEVDSGTTIRLSIPNKELPEKPQVWKNACA